MYEEIDISGQTKWILFTIVGFLAVVGLSIVRLFGFPLGDPPYNEQVALVAIIGFSPMAACLLGSILGALRKMAIKVNPDRLEFTDDIRNLNDFDKVYHEGDFRTGNLGGQPVYMCGTGLLVLIGLCIGFMTVFLMDTIGSFFGSIVEVGVVGIMYMAGVVFAYRGGYIRNKMIRNPLNESIVKNLSKYQVLQWITECDLVSKIIVRYKIGKGQTLKAIDDIHVLAVTSTEPVMEIEITIDDLDNFGLEYTYYPSKELVSRKEEIIDVAGKEAHLIVDEIDMKKYIQVRYEMGSLRASFNMRTPGSQCNLMHALVSEVSKYMSVTKIPKIEDSGPNE